MEKFHAAKPLAFSLHFLLRHDQHHYSNLTANIMKMCEQILKLLAEFRKRLEVEINLNVFQQLIRQNVPPLIMITLKQNHEK